jgi:hypothetical protein
LSLSGKLLLLFPGREQKSSGYASCVAADIHYGETKITFRIEMGAS